MQPTSLDRLTGDDLIDLLNNDAPFHQQWFALSERYIPSLFTISDSYTRGQREISYHAKASFLSYSMPEIHQVRMGELIQRAISAMADVRLTQDAVREATAYFIEKTLTEIELGAIGLPKDVTEALDALYGSDRINVAQVCRTTGKTRHAIKKLMDTYSEDMYRRYQAVQSGQRYAVAMGDCVPFVQDYPRFTPVNYISKENEIPAAEIIQPGDLVAESGSSRWYTVSELGASSGLIFSDTGGILHLPVRHLSGQYRAVANRFCGVIDQSHK